MTIFTKRFFALHMILCFVSVAYAQLPIEVMESLPDAAKPQAQQEEFLYPELEPEPGKYIVPPVVDRPLGATEGPRIKIDAIELRGAIERPEKGLMLDDVWKIIEDDRKRLPDGHTIGASPSLGDFPFRSGRSHAWALCPLRRPGFGGEPSNQ